MGMTTSPCDTRARSPSGWWARKVRMCDSWISAKFSDSSALTTLLASRFIPFSPAHWADRRLAPPYHIRPAKPGGCGCTRSENDLDALDAAEVGRRFAADEPQQPVHPLVAEVLDVGGIRVQRLFDLVVVHRRTDADARD